MKRIYILRHKDRKDTENESTYSAIANYIFSQEKGNNLAILSSPESVPFETADGIHNKLKRKGFSVKYVIPEGTFTGAPYDGHGEVDGVFPHYGLCELSIEANLKLHDPHSMIELFPSFREFGDTLVDKMNAREFDIDEADKRFNDYQNTFVNISRDPETISGIYKALEGKTDSALFLTHMGMIGPSIKILADGFTPSNYAHGHLQGAVIDFEEKSARPIFARPVFGPV